MHKAGKSFLIFDTACIFDQFLSLRYLEMLRSILGFDQAETRPEAPSFKAREEDML